jgi:hypothetical protein
MSAPTRSPHAPGRKDNADMSARERDNLKGTYNMFFLYLLLND